MTSERCTLCSRTIPSVTPQHTTTPQVKDHDLVGKHDDLGDYTLRIDDLPPLKPVDLELALCHTTKVDASRVLWMCVG